MAKSVKIQEPAHLALSHEIARADEALSGLVPVLNYLLVHPDHARISDDILARIRGLMADWVRQLLARAPGLEEERRDELSQPLYRALCADNRLVSHAYALAVEFRLTEQWSDTHAIDPVLTPLLQELIGDKKRAVAETAMTFLAAQARFVAMMRRMTLPVSELPDEIEAILYKHWKKVSHPTDRIALSRAAAQERDAQDAPASRLALLDHLMKAIGRRSKSCLDIEAAGCALFASALARRTKQPRELAIVALLDTQAARMALLLRAAGLDKDALERQFELLQGSARLPQEWDDITQAKAQALLSKPLEEGG